MQQTMTKLNAKQKELRRWTSNTTCVMLGFGNDLLILKVNKKTVIITITTYNNKNNSNLYQYG